MVYVLLIVAFLLLIAFFTSSEIALISANRVRLRTWVRRRRSGASFALQFLKRPDRFLSTILVGTNLGMVALTVVASRFLIIRYGRLGEVLSTFLVTLGVLILAEIIPKSLSSRVPEALATIVARPLHFLHYVFLPAVFLVNALSRGVLFLLGLGKVKGKPSCTKVELSTAVLEGERVGVLKATEREIVAGIFAFSQKTVRDVMIPREKMWALSVDSTHADLASIISRSRHSRIPIYQGDLDHIIGLVHAMDLVLSGSWDLGKLIRPVKSVHPNKHCHSLLNELRSEFSHLAIVTNGRGRTLGLVTLEDLVEVMVGEIRDEHDHPLTG